MHRVKVNGGITQAFVYLCDHHKTVVNTAFARRRTAGAAPRAVAS